LPADVRRSTISGIVTPRAPTHLYTADYFRTGNYADRPLGRFSMYWFARRYFAALVRRDAPAGGPERRLLEIGCGLGDMLALLQHDFACTGVDLIDEAALTARQRAPHADVLVGDGATWLAGTTTPLSVVVALHVVEHLPDPAQTIRDAYAALVPGGLLLFATPHPEYALRRFKNREHDAIGKDPTHINCHVPAVWRAWCEDAGFVVERHWGDGLWDVPYVPVVPKAMQFGLFGWPALLQVLTRGTWMPLPLGVNQIVIARRPVGT
jgi:SAM-dependent methyltransferase